MLNPDPKLCDCGGSGWTPGCPDDEPCPHHAASLSEQIRNWIETDEAERAAGEDMSADQQQNAADLLARILAVYGD
jgi:hypothetical protein